MKNKIQNLYKKKSSLEYSRPEFGLLQNINWIWTEKIGGVPTLIKWDGYNITNQIPEYLLEILNREKFEKVFGNNIEVEVTLLGNSFEKDFILFDILIGEWVLSKTDVKGIANKLGINTVPIVGEGTLKEAIKLVKKGFKSHYKPINNLKAEGLVCIPKYELFDRAGERIIVKIDQKDLI